MVFSILQLRVAIAGLHLIVAGVGLLPIRVQEGSGASTAQETRPRRQRDEELQTRIESAVPVEAAGENRAESTADLPGQKRPDAEDTVSVPSVSQH